MKVVLQHFLWHLTNVRWYTPHDEMICQFRRRRSEFKFRHCSGCRGLLLLLQQKWEDSNKMARSITRRQEHARNTQFWKRRNLDSFGLLWLRLAHRIPGILLKAESCWELLRVWAVKISMLSAMLFRCADGSAFSKDQVSTLWTLRAPAGEGGSGWSKEDQKTPADEHPVLSCWEQNGTDLE